MSTNPNRFARAIEMAGPPPDARALEAEYQAEDDQLLAKALVAIGRYVDTRVRSERSHGAQFKLDDLVRDTNCAVIAMRMGNAPFVAALTEYMAMGGWTVQLLSGNSVGFRTPAA